MFIAMGVSPCRALVFGVVVSACLAAGHDFGRADEKPESQTRNLVVSPSFEGPVGSNGLPGGWEGLNIKEGSRYRKRIVRDARTGEQALLIDGENGWGVASNERIPIDRAERYRARGWVKVEGHPDAAGDVKFHYFRGNQYLGQSRVGFVNPRTPGWQLITLTDQVEIFPQATHIQLAVALAGNGRAWFDDLEMTATKREPTPLNYVANGDMEDAAADRPAGYHVFSQGGEAECRISKEDPASGEQCLYVKGDGERAAAGSAGVEIVRGKTFRVTGQVRVESGQARLGIAYFDDNFQFLGSNESPPVSGKDWQTPTLVTEFDRHPAATRFSIVAVIEGEGAAYFDDFRAVPE